MAGWPSALEGRGARGGPAIRWGGLGAWPRRGGELGEVDFGALFVVVNYLVYAAVGAVVVVGLAAVALVFVIPIDEVHAAVLIVAEVDDLAPAVVEFHEVWAVAGDVAAAVWLQEIHV